MKKKQTELEQKLTEYQLLIDEVKTLKNDYTRQLTKLRRLIADYRTQTGGII